MMLQLSIEELEELLNAQKQATAEYITRNLSVYSFFEEVAHLDLKKIKEELRGECHKSGFAPDFAVLKKYLKQ